MFFSLIQKVSSPTKINRVLKEHPHAKIPKAIDFRAKVDIELRMHHQRLNEDRGLRSIRDVIRK
jgi:hypothetical protein